MQFEFHEVAWVPTFQPFCLESQPLTFWLHCEKCQPRQRLPCGCHQRVWGKCIFKYFLIEPSLQEFWWDSPFCVCLAWETAIQAESVASSEYIQLLIEKSLGFIKQGVCHPPAPRNDRGVTVTDAWHCGSRQPSTFFLNLKKKYCKIYLGLSNLGTRHSYAWLLVRLRLPYKKTKNSAGMNTGEQKADLDFPKHQAGDAQYFTGLHTFCCLKSWTYFWVYLQCWVNGISFAQRVHFQFGEGSIMNGLDPSCLSCTGFEWLLCLSPQINK